MQVPRREQREPGGTFIVPALKVVSSIPLAGGDVNPKVNQCYLS